MIRLDSSDPSAASITYPATLKIQPLDHAPDADIAVPGSKSITNRALILAALADGTSTLYGALDSDDTRVMLDSLNRLGITARWEQVEGGQQGQESAIKKGSKEHDARSIDTQETPVIRVAGRGGRIPVEQAELFVGNSGTSTRFLTALCALGTGPYTLDGVERMRQRPQQDLLAALSNLGVEAKSVNGNGCPPLLVQSERGLQGGSTQLRAEASSQFLSALLMAAPYAAGDVTIDILGTLRPFYVDITRRMMAQWGVTIHNENSDCFRVSSGQRYSPQTAYQIEPDASSASYFFAAAALTGGRVTVKGLPSSALQGDVKFAVDVLAKMGCKVSWEGSDAQSGDSLTVTGPPSGKLRGITVDMSAISDTALTLAAIAPFADAPTTVTGIAHSRHQECDRVGAACAELTRLGVQVEEHADGYTIYPAAAIKPATIQTYQDHRVAMSFALVGLKAPGVTINDPGCVAKTFPGYWRTLDRLR